MYAQGSNLGNSCRRIPQNSSSFVPILPQKRGFDLSHQYERNQVVISMDWRKHSNIGYCRHLIRNKIFAILTSGLYYEPIQQASDIANILEEWLFIDAASEEEYRNEQTLIQRFHTQLNTVFGAKCSQLQVDSSIPSTSQTVPSSGLLHAWSNGSLPELAFQVAGPIINATDYCSMTVNKKYGYPNGGLSHPPAVQEQVFSPDNCSSIPTRSDMDLFSDFPVSGGVCNVEASSKSNCSVFPQQLANDWEMDMLKYRGSSRTTQKNESMAFYTTTGKSLQSESPNNMIVDFVARNKRALYGNSEAKLPPPKRPKLESIQDKSGFNQEAVINATTKVIEPNDSNPVLDSISQMKTDDTSEPIFSSEIISSEDLEVVHISDEPDPTMHTLCNDTIAADNKGIQDRTGFNQEAEINATNKVIEPKADQQMEKKFSNATVNIVSLTEIFTSNQIKEHIMSLGKQFIQNTSEEETGMDANTCNLCSMQKLLYEPVPIYCFCCDIRIKRNAYYYYKKAEEFDTHNCFCTLCYNNSQSGHITFNGVSVSKTLLDRRKNDEVIEEARVQCDKCERWQHQICALFNNKRELDCGAEYICPICRLKDIKNGTHVPLPKTAIFCAKDLPSTMLSEHLEKRLFSRLMQEREERPKVEGNENVDEVLAAENLTIRVVLSVDKQLKVKNEFRDIFLEENYPTEFPYRSRVILLFQQIEGVDVCLFGMYVQEFGSECGNPNQRSVYISYLDSVKYFRPERAAASGEALRTFVYHELLIGYLDFCKKRGFTTCYIWACPPSKGEDYLLYCHPGNQKTPKNDKLRHWYHSMLRKAADENIVVGLSNIYDRFFVPSEKCDFKVTTAHLPYFDGDYWSGAAMDHARNIEQKSGGDYERELKKVTKRALKAMGYVNPSKGTAKDILVIRKYLGQTILLVKEDFIVVHLQYACMHCHEVIVFGRRWFCTECKKFQECERCHTADSHISLSGERHKLCQVLVDDIPSDTKENDIILNNELFEIRHNFLSFCQKNHFQFDTICHAKYSSMMILHHLNNLLVVPCSICSNNNVFQQSWKCEICREFTVCSACYEKRGANCHTHKLSQTCSTAERRSENQELKQDPVWMQEFLQVLLHASQCRPTKAQPCSYPKCIKIKKLFSHASKCTIKAAGGCQYCKKAWLGLAAHSKNCKDSECRVPRCKDLKKHAEWIEMQSESQRRAAIVESKSAFANQ